MANEYTKNYNLDLYTTADRPNLVAQYNSAMNKIDEQMHTNSTAVSDEVNRAKIAEQTNADAIQTETNRAKAAEQANSTAISNEITRATDAENTLSSKIDTNKADLAAIKSTRNDFYDPNTNINKYASYRNVYAQNNEHVQGMAISGNTLFIGASPINGGVASVYRYPNFAQNVEDLPSDARVVLNKSRNSHANDIEVFDDILYVTDGGINNANAAKIARIDAKTFEELEPLTLWYGGITDICIVQPVPDEDPNFVYIYGSSYDTQEVYMYQAYYDFSAKQMNVYPNVMKAGQFQPYNNRQAATYYKNTRIFLYSGQNGTDNGYKMASYLISSNPAQGTQGCVATIPWTGEAEGLAIFDNQLLFNSGNSIYSVGPVINFMNQRMNYSLLNRGYETNALAHIVTDCTALLNAPTNIGYMYTNRYRNGSAGIISMFVIIPGHGPVHLPLPLSKTLSEYNGSELSVSTSKYYAGSQTLVTYIFYYKLTMNKYMLQFQLTAIHAFTLTNNTTHNEYKNYADIPEGIKPTTVYIDYQDVN